MEKRKLNKFVSMYTNPVLGSIRSKTRYMALCTDPSAIKQSKKLGIAREITKSSGNPNMPGFVDQGKLITVESDGMFNWKKLEDLKINKIDKVITKLSEKNRFFIGLEDPDILIENKTKHVYFTIAFKCRNKKGYEVYLGHAKGRSLNKLTATGPVLGPIGKEIRGFKEVAISPLKTSEGRINLTEILSYDNKREISALGIVRAKEMDKPWEYLRQLNPKNLPYEWCRGYLSPCRILPKKFTGLKNIYLTIINGREKDRIVAKKRVYGKFCPGLILFNPKTGEIPWISPEPLFEDPDAKTITFATDFIQLNKDKGLLYCHVDDSFVRAYEIDLKKIMEHIIKKLTESKAI